MKIARYIDHDWHHYCVRDHTVADTIIENFGQYKETNADAKFSYLQDFRANTESLRELEQKIRQHLLIADHVFVGLGEPLFMFQDNVPEGPFYYTDHFINKFSKEDHVTFFANLKSHVPLKRPLHYLNDMFFEGINIYKEYDICKELLKKLKTGDEKYYWELMCSRDVKLYRMLKQHAVDSKTFSTCHELGISHWGPDVIPPSDKSTGGEMFSPEHSIRASDLIDPSIYNQSYYSCVVETVIPFGNEMSMFSEKEAKPIIAKRPFILVGTMNHLKALRDLGFKTFSPVIDESYDDEPDRIKRYGMILDSMNELTKMDPSEVFKQLDPILQHNHDHFYNNDWNRELLDAWFTPNRSTG